LVFPIGQYGGRFQDDPASPWHFVVRRGLSTLRLAGSHYLVWLAAHGSSARVGEIRWTRSAVLDLADEFEVPDPGTAYSELFDRGFVVEVQPDTPAATAFAGRHQLVPLTYSLGNTPEKPGWHGLGFPPKPWVSVPSLLWWLWQDAHLERSLRDACRALVARERRPGTTISSAMPPDRLLSDLLEGLHPLLSVHAVHLDLTRPGTDRRP
jgi:hypothetical protein